MSFLVDTDICSAHLRNTAGVMVTHNTKHFTDIPGLTVEDWLGP